MCGPYAYLRHPAYIAKVTLFFLTLVPFLGPNMLEIFRNCTLWLLLAGVYYMRAKTEERHLRSIGPEYDIYARHVSQNWEGFSKLKIGPATGHP